MPTFWLLCIGFSPFLSRQASGGQPWLFGFLGWAVALLITFLVHELGHALTAKRLADARPKIALGLGAVEENIFVFGGVAYWSEYNRRKYGAKTRALVSLAGPIAPILAALVVLACAAMTQTKIVSLEFFPNLFFPVPAEWMLGLGSLSPTRLFESYFVYGFFYSAYVWGLINLVPIFPLDGGQIMVALLGRNDRALGLKRGLPASICFAILIGIVFVMNHSTFSALFFFWLALNNYHALRRINAL